MPLGVEHKGFIQGEKGGHRVSQPLMPLGVEHKFANTHHPRPPVSQPLMPLGVEHEKYKFGRDATKE